MALKNNKTKYTLKEKLEKLRHEHAYVAGGARKFELEKDIEKTEKELEKFELKKINNISRIEKNYSTSLSALVRKVFWVGSFMIVMGTTIIFYGLVQMQGQKMSFPQFAHLPFPPSDSIFTVLVLRFEDYISKDETSCIGRSIETHLIDLNENGMPIKAVYANSILSPKKSTDAKKIQEHYNADLVIYGLVQKVQEKCLGAEVCFRHIVADTILGTFSMLDSIQKKSHGLDYIRTSPSDLEQELFYVNKIHLKFGLNP